MGIDALDDKAVIHHILAHSEPMRIRYGRRSTWIEEFLVRWEPETCTFGDALEQYRLGFDIVTITSLEKNIPFHSLQPFVSAKRLDRAPATAATNHTLYRLVCLLSTWP